MLRLIDMNRASKYLRTIISVFVTVFILFHVIPSNAINLSNAINVSNTTSFPATIKTLETTITIENVKTLPDKVKISSTQQFKSKIMTAAYLKKKSLTIEVSRYNKKDYNIVNINKYLDAVNFEKCFMKGYGVVCSTRITASATKASIYLKFEYYDLKKIGMMSLQKVKTQTQLNTVVKNAIKGKLSNLLIALADYKAVNYNIAGAVQLANKDYIISKKYTASSFVPNTVIILSNKVIKLNFKYVDVISENVRENKGITEGEIKAEANPPEKNEIEPEYNKAASIEQEYLKQKITNTNPLPSIGSNKLYNDIYNALFSFKTEIQYDPALEMDEVGDVVEEVLTVNPDINYIRNCELRSNGYNAKITFNYHWDFNLLTKIKQESDKKAEAVIKDIIKAEMDETQKLKAIHDYLILNSKYDYDNYLNNMIPKESFTAYGVLVKGNGVCQGYTAAFILLSKIAGIKSIGIVGNAGGEGHTWNMVQINGILSHIDVTWDDPLPDKQGRISYKYFIVSDEQLNIDHNWDKNKDYGLYFK